MVRDFASFVVIVVVAAVVVIARNIKFSSRVKLDEATRIKNTSETIMTSTK